MDPAIVALFCSLLGAIVLKFAEGVLDPSAPAELTHDQKIEGMANEILNGESDIPADTDSNCAVNHIRIFEQRMIDAGIATDLTICDDKKCKQCYPNLRGNGSNEAPEIGTTTFKRPKEERFASRLGRRKPPANPVPHGVDRLRSLEKERLRMAIAGSVFKDQRTMEVGGRVIPVPTHVPDNAKAVFQSDYVYNTYIIWSWITGSGRQMGFKQSMDIKTFESMPLAGKADITPAQAADKGYEQNVSCSKCHKQFWLKKAADSHFHVASFVCQACKTNGAPKAPKGRGGGSTSITAEYKHELEKMKKHQEQLKYALQTLNEMNRNLDYYKYQNKDTKPNASR